MNWDAPNLEDKVIRSELGWYNVYQYCRIFAQVRYFDLAVHVWRNL